MRRLAATLKVEAMSLYSHVANKVDVLDGMVDLIIGEISLPSPGGDWKAANAHARNVRARGDAGASLGTDVGGLAHKRGSQHAALH